VVTRAIGPTVYVIGITKNSAEVIFQRLHALDATGGPEQFGGPTTIQAKYPSKGDNSQGGYVIFDPSQYAERAGLLILNGVIYPAWTSHYNQRPYTGWVIGYNATRLKQTSIINLTPNGK
jgi:hypothetical protein